MIYNAIYCYILLDVTMFFFFFLISNDVYIYILFYDVIMLYIGV